MRNGIVDLIIKLGDEEYSLAKLFDMRVLSFSITPPKVVTNIVSIPYSNTFVDLTEVYGKPTYNQRNVEIVIDSIETTYIWQKYIDEIINFKNLTKMDLKKIIRKNCPHEVKEEDIELILKEYDMKLQGRGIVKAANKYFQNKAKAQS